MTRIVKNFTYIVLAISLNTSGFCLAQDITNLGGDLSTDTPGHNAIQVTAPNVTDEDRRVKQLSGFVEFHKIFNKDEGLGPRFANASCGGCHVQNGKGRLSFRNPFFGSSMVVKVGQKGRDAFGNHKPLSRVGKQLQDHDLSGRKFYDLRLQWHYLTGKYADGSTYRLRKPNLNFKIPNKNLRDIRYSLRMSPLLVGMGLLEAISDDTILSLSDPNDSNSDGISGRANIVRNVRTGGLSIGRFGFKATHPTVEQQTSAALIGDMGITNALFPAVDLSYEFSDELLDRLTIYQMIPGVPKARDQNDPQVLRGKALFQELNCNSCHTMSIQTGNNPNPELVGQMIHPFTDMLLHDMGSLLGDGFAEFGARSSEWRTTPLWGIGFSETLSSVKPTYLHDGRARTLQEAILWHGGEAKRSRELFRRLSKDKRLDLVRFLRSL